MQLMVWVTSDGIKKLSCDRLPVLRERLQVGLIDVMRHYMEQTEK